MNYERDTDTSLIMPSIEDTSSPAKKLISGLSATTIGIVLGTLFIILIIADSLLVASGQLDIGSILGALIMAFGVYGTWTVFNRFRVEGAKQ
jgi:hypothetical protein